MRKIINQFRRLYLLNKYKVRYVSGTVQLIFKMGMSYTSKPTKKHVTGVQDAMQQVM